MRPVPLYNLKQGINRLRIKGGANPSSLYDLLNAWITVDGSVDPREGTIRAQALDGTTHGLMADDGIFNVFSITQESVPAGYVDNILLNPNDSTQDIATIWFAKPFMGFPYVVAQFNNGDVFHYWLQNSGTWAANTIYDTGTLILPLTSPTGLAYLAQRVSTVNPTWQPETGIALNTIIEPTEYTGFQYKAVAVAGASPHTGQTEPTWPIAPAGILQEFGDFDTSSTDSGTSQPTTTTSQPLSTTITDRYGDSSTIASAGSSAGGTLTLPTSASTNVTTWAPGTLYAPGAVVQPSASQGGFLNAIPNGDFEAGNDGNWVLSSGAAFYSGINVYQGTFALSFSTNASNDTAVMNTYGVVTPGQSVTASCYFNPHSSGANLEMFISLNWYNSSDVFLSRTSSVHQENGGYRLTTVTGVAPPGAAHCRVQLEADGAIHTPQTGYADLVSWNLETPAPVSNFLFEAVQAVAATSASTEPTWPTVAGNTVIDGGVTWKAIGTSIITWEAIPIMQSGAVEPTWPTTVPTAVHDTSSFTDQNGAVIDTSISWIASSRQITDPKCPNTIGVALNSSHVFAIDKDIVDFSAAVDPTDWSSANNAGYLPTGLNNYGDNPAMVLALYRSNLIALNAGGYQMWQTDPDPANMAILDAQPVGSIYTRGAQSVANDLLFVTEVGVRNLATVGATANMQVGSTGQPVDPLVLAQLKGNGTTPLVVTMTASHASLAPTNIGYRSDLVPPFGSAVPATLVGLDGRTYSILIILNEGTISNDFVFVLGYTGAAPSQNTVFASISFTDKNSVGHTFLASNATFSAAGGEAQWFWTQGSGAMFADAGVYPISIGFQPPLYAPISLYYPGKGQYWLFFGPQALVLTVNGQGLRTWSRYVFPDTITDWTLNAGVLYLRTAGNLVWQLDASTLVDDFGGANIAFEGVIQTPYVDAGPMGYDKELIGIDLVGDGEVNVQIAWAQNDVTTFNDNPGFSTSLNVSPPYTVDASDTIPGQPIPFPMTAPSFSVILTFAGNQAWKWQASTLYLQDVAGTPTG
jgi:hypothetical protein